MYINTFKYTPKDVSCQLCTEYVKKLGCTALRCPWLAERIEAGVVGYREAVLETFPHERRLFQRMNLLIKHYPGSLWSNEQHERRMQYQCAVQGYRRRRDTNAYYAAMYLLTSNDDIYRRTANCFCKDGIEFGYRASNQANTACKEAIEAAIRDHYRDNRLDAAAVDQVVQQFGYDRTFHVLAITVCQADWDRRYSPDNRAWANAMSIPANPDTWGTDRNCYLAVNSHPGLVDLFLSQTRKAYAQERQKTSVRDKLKKPPETTSPKISAKSKAPER